MVTAPSVVESVGTRRIMEDLLLDRTIKKGFTNCVNPAHDDEHPSMSVDLDAGVFHCFSCSVQGGALDLAVLRGVGTDRADAAKILAEKYHVGNGHAAPKVDRPWPYFPKTVEQLGWELDLLSMSGSMALRVPTYLPDGSRGKTKLRGQRGPNGKLQVKFENDATDCGLINWPAVLDHLAGAQNPTSAMVAGETDLLAWTWACKAEGLDIPAFSMSTGEAATISDDYAQKLKGTRVYLLFDNDDAGRDCRDRTLAALRRNGAEVTVHPVPAPHKDTRDYVMAGGQIRDLIRDTVVPPGPIVEVVVWDYALTMLDPPPPEPKQLVHQVFTRNSTNIVFGSPGSGKSWAILGLCLDAVLGGGNFMGSEDLFISSLIDLRDDREERCLWVFGSEDNQARVNRRIRKVHLSGPHADKVPRPGSFVYATRPRGLTLKSTAGAKWLEDLIRKFQPSILTLDTIRSLCPDLDVSSSTEVMPFIDRLNGLRDVYDLTTFGIHHTRKGTNDPKKDSGSIADAMLGSEAWRSQSDGCLLIDAKDGNTLDVRVRLVKSKDLEQPVSRFRASFERDHGRFHILDDEEDAPAEQTVQRTGRTPKFSAEAVLTLRTRFPDGIRWRDVQHELKFSNSTWFERHGIVLSDLCKAGCVMIDGVLKWGD